MNRIVLLVLFIASSAHSADVVTQADSDAIPARFKLEPASFNVTVTPKYTLTHSGVEVFDVSYPSPVKTIHVENNTVVGELFRPMNATGKMPAVLVLDILDGAQVVSRMQAMWLASRGITAMTMQMAYYGPRRPPGTKLRMLMPDMDHSTAALTQTVQDARRAIAYLASRPDVDAAKIGVLGTSLGSFVGGLVTAAEPKVSRAALLLGGGGLVEAFYENPKGEVYRKQYEQNGGTKEKLAETIKPFDPLTYADILKDKKLLLIAASRDDVVPPYCTKCLWEATGKQKVMWVDANHVGGVLHLFSMMTAVVEHLSK